MVGGDGRAGAPDRTRPCAIDVGERHRHLQEFLGGTRIGPRLVRLSPASASRWPISVRSVAISPASTCAFLLASKTPVQPACCHAPSNVRQWRALHGLSNEMIGMRVADRIARALEHAGARVVFTVSGNHVMSVFDALGAYGEVVTSAKELPDALDRAFRCAGPACINVMIEQVPAPVIDI